MRVPFFNAHPEIAYIFTTKALGDSSFLLDFDYRKKDDPTVERSFSAIASYFGVEPSSVYVTNQVHGNRVEIIEDFPGPALVRGVAQNDATVTALSGLVLTVLTADCVPILMADPKRGAIAAVHAGWRGTVCGIAGKAVEAFEKYFASLREDILVAIGPAIGKCCYEVGSDVTDEVKRSFSFGEEFLIRSKTGYSMLDLAGLNARILMGRGIAPANIWTINRCTACDEKLFYSYRRDGAGTGRMMAAICKRGGR